MNLEESPIKPKWILSGQSAAMQSYHQDLRSQYLQGLVSRWQVWALPARIWFYWMFYDHFSARSLLAKLGRSSCKEAVIPCWYYLMIFKGRTVSTSFTLFCPYMAHMTESNWSVCPLHKTEWPTPIIGPYPKKMDSLLAPVILYRWGTPKMSIPFGSAAFGRLPREMAFFIIAPTSVIIVPTCVLRILCGIPDRNGKELDLSWSLRGARVLGPGPWIMCSNNLGFGYQGGDFSYPIHYLRD